MEVANQLSHLHLYICVATTRESATKSNSPNPTRGVVLARSRSSRVPQRTLCPTRQGYREMYADNPRLVRHQVHFADEDDLRHAPSTKPNHAQR